MQQGAKTLDIDGTAIVLTDTGGEGLPLVMLHGSGSSRQIFERQLLSPLRQTHRLIALDLPGHGESADAVEPKKSYTLTGLATTIAGVLDRLAIARPAVFGWSLGGHIAIELASMRPIAGLMLTGTPPVGRGPLGVLRGFHANLDAMLASKEKFSERDVERFARISFGDNVLPEFLASIRRADGRLRPIMFNSLLRGDCADQKRVVEELAVPVGIINGSDEPFARLGYLASLRYQHLWDGVCHVLPDIGHAPFWQASEPFNAMLGRFMSDVAALPVPVAVTPAAVRLSA